jgi:hypothetical protein
MGDKSHIPHVELLIKRLPEPIHKLLAAAAERRHLSASELAAQIIGGVVARGAVDKQLTRFRQYQQARYDANGNRRRNRSSAVNGAQV